MISGIDEMSAALAAEHETFSRFVASPLSEIEPYPAHFLQRFRIYRVLHTNPPLSVLFYVGFAPGERAYVLTQEPENYVEMARADGATIDSEQTAVQYVTAYLEVTRKTRSLFYVVSSPDDILFRPELNEQEDRVKADFLATVGAQIAPPRAARTGEGYTVTVYVVNNDGLERRTATVSPDGGLREDVVTIASDLPLVYGLN
jgi:hypothetical protein